MFSQHDGGRNQNRRDTYHGDVGMRNKDKGDESGKGREVTIRTKEEEEEGWGVD